MIRYRYAQQLNPPAPFVHVTLRCPATGARAPDLAAQVDHGADRTVLPGQVVEALGLVEDGRAQFQGFAGEIVELPIFLVEVQVHDLAPQLTRAVLGQHEPHILLGRDVLNTHRVLLDGPQLALEIDRPAAGS
jgi:predicted aspartyl protease